MTVKHVLGVDVSKLKLDIALFNGNNYQMASFANTTDGLRKLRKFLKKKGARGCPVVLEATGTYGDLVARSAYGWKAPVYIVNPKRIKAHRESLGKQNKTDMEDAKVIAHFGTFHEMTLWHPPTPSQETLQAYTRRLEVLKKTRAEEQNRQQAGRLTKSVRTSIKKHIAFLDKQIAQLEQEINQHIDNDPSHKKQAELLETIPGIGRTTAAQFLAEVPNLSRFPSARTLAAFAGLTPRKFQSGSSVLRRSRMTKAGGYRLRAMLYMPAISAMRFNPLIKSFVARLRQEGKHSMVIIVAVMRKLLHLMYGVLKTKQPFDPDYLVNAQVAS